MICKGILRSGLPCRYRAKYGNYCGHHKGKTSPPRQKKEQAKFSEKKPLECPICFESLESELESLECGHWVHVHCVMQWREFQPTKKAHCPICRKELTTLSPPSSCRREFVDPTLNNEYTYISRDQLEMDLINEVTRYIMNNNLRRV